MTECLRLSALILITRRVLFATAPALVLSSCNWGPFYITGSQYAGSATSTRFYNATRVNNLTLNLADTIASACRTNDSEAIKIVEDARAAAANIDTAIAVFGESPEAEPRVTQAVQDAAKIGRLAFYKALSCGGVPPEIPNIPGYSETFWDVASP